MSTSQTAGAAPVNSSVARRPLRAASRRCGWAALLGCCCLLALALCVARGRPPSLTPGTAAAVAEALAGGAVADAGQAEKAAIRTIPLHKQYVPVYKGQKAVAYKTAYFGKVYAGGPEPQEFTVVFDTGSGHVILPSTSCHSETCMKHRRFNRTASSSAVDIEYDGSPLRKGAEERDQMSIAFGTGEVLGEFVRETVCLGSAPATSADGGALASTALAGADASSPHAGCATVRMVLARTMSEDPFGLFAFDGVLGLGLSALTLSPAFNFVASMTQQDPSMPPLFAVFLSRHDSGASAISFGGHDERYTGSDIFWAPVAKEEHGFWNVRIKSVRIGDHELEDCADGGCSAILDTGTSLLGVPKQSTRTLHRMLARPAPGSADGADTSGAAAVDCRRVAGLPIEFHLGDGAVVRLLPEDYSRPTPFNMTVPGGGADGKPSSRLFCRSLLLPLEMGPPLGNRVFIWGEPVLRRYYTIYDAGAKRVGFSVARQPAEEATDVADGAAIGAPPAGSLLSGAPLEAAS